MKPRILLVNPPIYDFTAYDFWLKPYGMIRAAGLLRGRADFRLFDFMDPFDVRVPAGHYRRDAWGRGEFCSQIVAKPAVYENVPRHYRRFGLPREEFQKFLAREGRFEYALVQTVMTYWYPGVGEVIEDLRHFAPESKIILGGVYATVCSSHAQTLEPDFIVEGLDLQPLWSYLRMAPGERALPLWDLYPQLPAGVLKITDGCPFRCTYCTVPQVYPRFSARPIEQSLREFDFLVQRGAADIAFYDDALLYRPEQIFVPFLRQLVTRDTGVRLHTPNALNARFLTPEIARLMVRAGFTTVFLGFESSSYAWQKKTGGKVCSDELARAVDYFTSAGMETRHIHAYLIVGHPLAREQECEESMRWASRLGIRIVLSEFAPVPGTPDGEMCRLKIDLDEPLYHNKTAFTILSLGAAETQRLKNLARDLNRKTDPEVPRSKKESPEHRVLSSEPVA